MPTKYRGVEQLVARRAHNPEVVGSSPASATIKTTVFNSKTVVFLALYAEFSKRHDLPHINPHAFRHTMASILINSGKDVVSVSKRLGHAKVSTTTDIYSHIIMEADEQASECLADVMLRPTKKKAAM